MFGEYGHFLTTILEEDEEEDGEGDEDDVASAATDPAKPTDSPKPTDATKPTDSTNTRSLLQRIFLDFAPRAKVASRPKLDDIEEEEEAAEPGNVDDEPGSLGGTIDSDSESADSSSVGADTDDTDDDGDTSTLCDFDYEFRDAHFDFVANHLDSLHFSLASVSTVDEGERRRGAEDPDLGWVWIDFEGSEVSPSAQKARGLGLRRFLRRLFVF